MRYIWDEAKRLSNLRKHGLDFRDAHRIFANPVYLTEDSRHDYGEQRMVAVGLLSELVVVMVHVESDAAIRIISFARQLDMKRTSTSRKSAPLDDDDAPPLTKEFFKRVAEYRVAGKKVTKAEWQVAARAHLAEQLAQQAGKQRISIMLDNAVIEHFRAAAGARGYQTLINEALKKFISGETLASELRTVLREELAAYKIK